VNPTQRPGSIDHGGNLELLRCAVPKQKTVPCYVSLDPEFQRLSICDAQQTPTDGEKAWEKEGLR